MGKFINEFKKFAFKGNVLDMAVGVVIGAAFGKIVSSFVADIITPLISLLTRGTPIRELFLVLGDTNGHKYATAAEAAEAGFSTLNYGLFFQNVIDFFIIALSVFIAIKLINKSRERLEKTLLAIKDGFDKDGDKEKPAEEAPAPPTTKECPFCTSVISIKATRCPHCTSVLDEKTEDK